jgi:hypothetical protein
MPIAGRLMPQLTLYGLLSLAVCFALAIAQSVGASPAPLLPGYTHRQGSPGRASIRGEIWKPNGPTIDYDIGPFVGATAEEYVQRFPKLPALRISMPGQRPFTVVVDEEHDAILVSVYQANFHAHNVRTRVDASQVLTIAKALERDAGPEQSARAIPVPILPEYHDGGISVGIDSVGAQIWKANGPGYLLRHLTHELELPSATCRGLMVRLTTPTPSAFLVEMDEEHDAMRVEFCRIGFEAHNVRSRTEVAEVFTLVKISEVNTDPCR